MVMVGKSRRVRKSSGDVFPRAKCAAAKFAGLVSAALAVAVCLTAPVGSAIRSADGLHSVSQNTGDRVIAARSAIKTHGAGGVVVEVRPLDLGSLAPSAFADWDTGARSAK